MGETEGAMAHRLAAWSEVHAGSLQAAQESCVYVFHVLDSYTNYKSVKNIPLYLKSIMARNNLGPLHPNCALQPPSLDFLVSSGPSPSYDGGEAAFGGL